MRTFIGRFITLVVLSLSAVSCGTNSSNVLSGLAVSSQTVNNDVMLSVSADLNLGSMSFASLSLPILHPQGQTPIGTVELVPMIGGKNQIKINVNLSSLTGVNSTLAVLPNGGAIPLIANNQTIMVSLGGGARLYLTLSDKVTAIGVAVPISAFDNLGSNLGGLNFFPVTNVNGVTAAAGIFTSVNAGQNGIAIVADVSSIVNLGGISYPSNSEAVVSIMSLQAQEAREVVLDYSSKVPSVAKQNSLNSLLYKLHLKKAKLSPLK